MFNLLIEKPCREWHGYFLKTNYQTWIRFKIAIKSSDEQTIIDSFIDLFEEVPEDLHKAVEDIQLITSYIQLKSSDTAGEDDKPPQAEAFCYDHDSDVIWAEMWRYFPALMASNPTWHEFATALYSLLSLPTEQSQLSKIAFARVGDFSKLSKGEREHWQALRSHYALPMSDNEKDEQEQLIEILKNSGDLSQLKG